MHEVSAPAGYEVAPDKVITVTNSTALQAFTFVNSKGADLSVTKQVTGALGDKTKAFGFTLTLSGDDAPTSVSYERSDGTNGTLVLADGKGMFTLAHGQTVTFKALPEGVAYAVTEDQYDDYDATYSDNATGTIGDENIAVSVMNTYSINVVLPDTGSKALVALAMAAVMGIAFALWQRRRAHCA